MWFPKFTKTKEELETLTDQWLYVLRNLHKLLDKPTEFQSRIFERLFKITKYKSLTPEEMETYKTNVLEYDSVKEAIRWEAERSERRGLELGKLQTAQAMLRGNMSLQEAAKYTGLSIDDIIAYINKQK